MYRILLVDDEGIVLNSMTFLIEKNFDGKFEIETAKSGRAAIELSETFRPDIIFMDIQMPRIGGIEAMKEIRKILPGVIFVVLTAYDKFDYAKEAINLGVMEYLNKPFNQKDVVAVLQTAMEKIDEKQRRRREDLETREKMETVMPIIENGFIYSIVFEEQIDEDIASYKNLLGIDSAYGYMMVLVFGDDQQGHLMTNVVGSSVKAQTTYYSKVRELIKDAFSEAIVGNVSGNRIPIFIPSAEDHMELSERGFIIEKCRALTRSLKNATEISYRIGIGGMRRLRSAPESYEEAIKALVSTSGSVAHVDDLPIAVSYEESYPAALEADIFEKLEDGDTDATLVKAEEFFEWMSTTHADDIMSVKLKTLEFVLRAESLMYQSGGPTYEFTSRKDYLQEIMNTSGIDALKSWYMNKFRAAAGGVSTGSKDRTHHVIKKALEYIDNNFHKDISLDELAGELGISSYYFSKLFKEEKGEGFVEYLTGRRVEEAKRLLADPEHSIKEVGIACGYSDPNYFSRIFKKQTGVTPTEYRDRI
jgi:two-component system response regulator YesN